jgi:hypothetical protein
LGEISEEELVQAVAQTKSSAGRELMVIPEVMPVMDEEDE